MLLPKSGFLSMDEIKAYLESCTEGICKSLLKMYFYREPQWKVVQKEKQKHLLYSSCSRSYLIKGSSTFPKKELIYYYLWGSIKGEWETKLYNKYINELVLEVEYENLEPQVLVDNERIQETYNFIDDYMQGLAEEMSSIARVTRAWTYSKAEELLKSYSFDIDVDKYFLWSMGNLHKQESGLPVNIWIDVGGTYKKGRHGKRIKFQTTKANHWDEDNYAIMTIRDEPEVIGYVGTEIDKKDIRNVAKFVKKYKVELEKLADQQGLTFKQFQKLVEDDRKAGLWT